VFQEYDIEADPVRPRVTSDGRVGILPPVIRFIIAANAFTAVGILDPNKSVIRDNGHLIVLKKNDHDGLHLRLFVFTYPTALITRPTFSKISPISISLTISGGVSAMVSPVTRITMFSSAKAFSIAS